MMNKQGSMREKLRQLASELEGELYDDTTIRTSYATDASAYREMPFAVAGVPKKKHAERRGCVSLNFY